MDKALVEKLKEKQVVIFGAGVGGRFLAEMLTDMGIAIRAFWDNAKEKQGSFQGGLPIVLPEEGAQQQSECFVALSVWNREIRNQMEVLGISEERLLDFSFFSRGRKIPCFDEFCKGRYPKEKLCFVQQCDLEIVHTSWSREAFCGEILFVSGWVLPADYITNIKIRVNGGMTKEILREQRDDVKRLYLYRNAENCGFYFIGHVEDCDEVNVELSFWHEEQCVRVLNKKVSHRTLKNVIRKETCEGVERKIVQMLPYLCEMREEIVNIARKEAKTVKDIVERLIYYHVLFHLSAMTASDMEEYLKLVEKRKDTSIQAWICEQQIPWMTFLYPEIKASNLFCWKRNMYLIIAKELFKECKELREKHENKIVILVDSIGSKVLASARLELGIANEMTQRGYRVLVVASDTFQPEATAYSVCDRRKRKSVQYADEHEEMRNGDWEIYYCQREGFIERELEAWSVIEAFAPGVVLDVSHDGLLLSAGLYQHGYKIIHLPLSGYSSGAVFHRYIAKSIDICRKENEFYHSIKEEQMIEAPILVPYTLSGKKEYVREDFGLAQDDFVMVTVGNRLKYELHEDFLNEIKRILAQDFGLKWIVVGNNLSSLLYEMLEIYIKNGQVILWGFEENLEALYSLCNLYLNPKRMGGGGSITMAMQMGIPVAMTKDPCDIIKIVKTENCKKDYKEMMRYILELKNSKSFWQEESKKMKKVIEREEIQFGRFVEKILDGCKEVML